MKIPYFFLIISLFCAKNFAHAQHESNSLQALYARLDPTSAAQHFAFYELYSDTALGKEALEHAWSLLQGEKSFGQTLPTINIQALIQLFHRSFSTQTVSALKEEELQFLEHLANKLSNRSLKGQCIWSLKELLNLDLHEIDLARGLFLAEMKQDTVEDRIRIRSYEAYLDLMALQIFARLPTKATNQEKIVAINDYIFRELRFRFPPHSLYAKDIDQYTLLPSVLDSRRGVCLGVSVLYLCLAQRLDLPLEAITPPGHIYVRYVEPSTQEIINIETTARGIDVPSEHYLGLDTRSLQTRNKREVIGLVFQNQAAVSWQQDRIEEAICLYEKAQLFLKDDYLINLFLGLNYLFAGKVQEGASLLTKIQDLVPEHKVIGDSVPHDYLQGLADPEAIRAVYSEVDEKRSSILEKQKKLEDVVKRCPQFRQGLFHLAVTHLQLGRLKNAIPYLEKNAQLDPEDPTVNYYLSAIYFQRVHYQKAWHYLKKAEEITQKKNHTPKALQELRESLQRVCPDKNLVF